LENGEDVLGVSFDVGRSHRYVGQRPRCVLSCAMVIRVSEGSEVEWSGRVILKRLSRIHPLGIKDSAFAMFCVLQISIPPEVSAII